MTDNNPLVSIVVPIYNSEKDLDRCLDSLVNQTYRNLEILLVDDGSTDNSIIICQRYKKSDSRIWLHRKANGGVSSARNFGLERASGDFIYFMDSDDWIEPDTFRFLIDMMIQHNAQASIFEYQVDYVDGKSIPHCHEDNSDFVSSDDAIYATISPANRFVWSKIFSKEIIRDIRFDENIQIGEDTLFSVEVLLNAKKVFYTSKTFYHYVQTKKSATRSGFSTYYFTVLSSYSKINLLVSTQSRRTRRVAIIAYSNFLEIVIYGIFSSRMINQYDKAYLYAKELVKNVLKAIFWTDMSLKLKIKLLFCGMFPRIYCKAYQVYRINKGF